MSGMQDAEHAAVVDLGAEPSLPEGWAVEEHVKGGRFAFDASKVALAFSVTQESGEWIEGHALRSELVGRGAFNANLLDWLLRPENRHRIPDAWKATYVFFWGTVYRCPDGSLRVRHLRWHERNGWSSDDRRLDVHWRPEHAAAIAA